MARYSQERKDAILSKLLPPHNKTVMELASQENISAKTLYTWRDKAKREGKPVPGKRASSESWSSEAKLAVVIETAALSESELSQYCREKGLYPEQVHRWKASCLQGFVNRSMGLGIKAKYLGKRVTRLGMRQMYLGIAIPKN